MSGDDEQHTHRKLADSEENEVEVPSPVSPTMRTETHANSVFRFADSAQTLIFLDWDDTMFPTAEIFDNWGFSSNYETWGTLELSLDQEHMLERWGGVVELYLKTACALSDRVVIVTNAKSPWVSECVNRFAPNLQSMFSRDDGPRVVYAREVLASQRLRSLRAAPARHTEQEAPSPDEVREQLTKAKFAAMQREAKSFYSQYPGQTWKNILSVGDAKYEHDAAQDLAFRRKSPARECLRLKTLITPVCPRIRDLTYRLRLATVLWPVYVKFDGDMDFDMNSPEQLQSIADALQMPELKSVIRPTPLRAEDEEGLSNDFDELVMLVHDRMFE